jgi:hypothetical protein
MADLTLSISELQRIYFSFDWYKKNYLSRILKGKIEVNFFHKFLNTQIRIPHSMNKVVLCGMLAISLGVLGTLFMDGQESQATDFTNSSLPIDNTTILIEEEKEEDESNVTTSTPISESLQTEN